MKKTAMQELIEVIMGLNENESINDIHFKSFLNKEKNQIIEARADGLEHGLYFRERDMITHQQYYNNNYKQD